MSTNIRSASIHAMQNEAPENSSLFFSASAVSEVVYMVIPVSLGNEAVCHLSMTPEEADDLAVKLRAAASNARIARQQNIAREIRESQAPVAPDPEPEDIDD